MTRPYVVLTRLDNVALLPDWRPEGNVPSALYYVLCYCYVTGGHRALHNNVLC